MENLASLPIVVLDEIFKNLKSRELNNLRSTCRTLNSTINQPKYLKRIKINIQNRKQLKNILNGARVGHIYSVVCGYRDYTDFRNKIKFVDKFKSNLNQVKFNTFDCEFMNALGEAKVEILNICGHFQGHEIWSDILKLKNLNNLAKLKVKVRDATVQDLIGVILQASPNLNHVRLPIWQSIDPRAERTLKPIEPLINFIKSRSNQLTLDFGGYGHTLGDMKTWMHEIKKINARIFPITPSILLQICQNSSMNSEGLKLRNVQLSSLPEKTELTNEQFSNLRALNCIESIVMIQPPGQNYRQKFFPPKAQIKLAISGPSNLEFDQNLNITLVHWRLWGTIGVKNSPADLDLDSEIYADLYENDRKKLIQLYVAQSLPIYIRDSFVDLKFEVCSKFPNLKRLYLSGFELREWSASCLEWKEMRNWNEEILKFEF